ncbi:M20 family metallopeptidase [Psychrilyobacter sp.]|uniref:M20 family metallopeptidase n=1 Tax=Psychrilyobacter sp. TaxID=2586924 RepID=UPI003018F129
MITKAEIFYSDHTDELIKLNYYIYKNPELGNQEIKASDAHTSLLEKNGFQIEKEFVGIKTAFKATYTSKKDGPKIAFLAEYDALPKIGHGCGHNILGTASTGAGLILKELIDELGGEVIVLGTPAEETDGAKVDMAKAGVFEDIDIVMSAHPTGKFHVESGSSQAMEAIRFKYFGKTAHAAGSPHLGINALDGVITLFNGINAMRQQICETDRIHGIIKNGGEAANIIPDFCSADFYVRSRSDKELKILSERVKKCAEGAALATGTRLKMENYEYSFKDLITNKKLSETYIKNLKLLGVKEIKNGGKVGSTDIGDISYCCPVIHPYFPISERELIGHSVEFAQASITEKAHEGMKEAILSMVMTAVEIIVDEELLKEIKEEFLLTHKK